MKSLIVVLCIVAVLLAAAFLPVSIGPYLDFQVLYHADLGLLRGISLYDHAGQVDMVAAMAKVPPSQVFVLPFPYPPWYALSTLWLALTPIQQAARVWFTLNLVMLLLSWWLLSSAAPPVKRLLLLIPVMLWPPVLGSLFVGQYGFPVLLGAALMVHGLQREKTIPTVVAAVLLTFKPHLGTLVLLFALVFCWTRRHGFGRRSLLLIIAAGFFLLAIGFTASPLWPVDYFRSLTGFRQVSQCHQCVSPAMLLAGITGSGFGAATWISALLLVGLLLWTVLNWRVISASGERVVIAGVLMTLLVSPYLQNYDYLLLVVPFLLFAWDTKSVHWLWLGIAYLVPLTVILLFGTEGSRALVLSTVILAVFAVRAWQKESPATGAA